MKNKKQTIFAQVWQEVDKKDFYSSSRYGHVRVFFYTYENDDITQIIHSPWEFPVETKHLEVSCQLDNNGTTNGNPYAWNTSFHNVNLDTGNCDRMVKTLRHIERGLAKIEKQIGNIESFEDYVVRVCRSIGVDKFVFPADNSEKFITDSASSAKYRITRMIQDVQDSLSDTELKKAA